MWSVPFNLNLYDTHMGLAMIYNQGPFSSSSYWFNKMYYSDIGPHVRGMGGKVIILFYFDDLAFKVRYGIKCNT